jgi:alpha-beta hydrolase superfamily lysophospholipase
LLRLVSLCGAVFSALLVASASSTPQERTSRVTFQTPDGRVIAASLYEPGNRPAPGVVLVHMLGRSRRDWEPVAEKLSDAGIAALAIDLRGHGESGPAAGGDDERGRLTAMVADVRTAKRFLETRSEIARDRIGLAGASLGASLAAIVAGDDLSVRSIALLSPAVDYRGLRMDAAMRKYGQRRALFIASREDPYAWRTMRDLSKDAPAREMILLDVAGHGTAMLARDESLASRLVDWFRRTL